jgi:hypothetical protein
MVFERLQPSKLQAASSPVQVEADADQTPAARLGTGWVTACALGRPSWQPFGDPSGSCPSGFDLFGAAVPRYFSESETSPHSVVGETDRRLFTLADCIGCEFVCVQILRLCALSDANNRCRKAGHGEHLF